MMADLLMDDGQRRLEEVHSCWLTPWQSRSRESCIDPWLRSLVLLTCAAQVLWPDGEQSKNSFASSKAKADLTNLAADEADCHMEEKGPGNSGMRLIANSADCFKKSTRQLLHPIVEFQVTGTCIQ